MNNNLVDRLDHYSIRNNLIEMSEIDRWYTGEAKSEYYYLYEENCIDISTRAYEMFEQIEGSWRMRWLYEFFGGDAATAWDAVVGSMSWISHGTFCGISGHDPHCYDPYEVEEEQKKMHEKIMRLTKKAMLELMTWVTGTLMQYMEIRAAYDAIYSVLGELEANNSMLNSGNVVTPPQAAGVL